MTDRKLADEAKALVEALKFASTACPDASAEERKLVENLTLGVSGLADRLLARLDELARLTAENARLRKALGEIKDTARRQVEDEEDARLRSPYGLGCTHNLSDIEEMAEAALSASKDPQ